MSIENDLKRIADALEKIAVSVSSNIGGFTQSSTEVVTPNVGAKSAKKKEAVSEPVNSINKEQLTDMLRECVLKGKHKEAKATLGKFSAERISEVKSEDMDLCFEALKELANAEEKSK